MEWNDFLAYGVPLYRIHSSSQYGRLPSFLISSVINTILCQKSIVCQMSNVDDLFYQRFESIASWEGSPLPWTRNAFLLRRNHSSHHLHCFIGLLRSNQIKSIRIATVLRIATGHTKGFNSTGEH